MSLPGSPNYSGYVFAQQVENTVWMATGRWLARINSKTGKNSFIELPESKYSFDNNPTNRLILSTPKSGTVIDLEVDEDGNIWIARVSTRSLTKYTEGHGFKEYKAPGDLKQPDRPVAAKEGILVTDAETVASDNFKPSVYILKKAGTWARLEPPGIPEIKNAHGILFTRSRKGNFALDGGQGDLAYLKVDMDQIRGLLSLGRNELWFNDENSIIKYDVKSSSRQKYALPLKEAWEKAASLSYGDEPAPDIETGPIFDTSAVAKDGSFWASYMIAGQLYIVGVTHDQAAD